MPTSERSDLGSLTPQDGKFHTPERGSVATPDSTTFDQPQDSQKQFLSCSIGVNTAILLPIEQLVEILNFSFDQITPIPHLPPWVRGVYNWRGEVLWTVDLAQLLGLELAPMTRLESRTIANPSVKPQLVVLQGQKLTATGTWTTLGVMVEQAGDLEWCSTHAIQSPPATAFTPTLARFLQGYWLKETGDILLCPSVNAIFAAMPQVNQF